MPQHAGSSVGVASTPAPAWAWSTCRLQRGRGRHVGSSVGSVLSTCCQPAAPSLPSCRRACRHAACGLMLAAALSSASRLRGNCRHSWQPARICAAPSAAAAAVNACQMPRRMRRAPCPPTAPPAHGICPPNCTTAHPPNHVWCSASNYRSQSTIDRLQILQITRPVLHIRNPSNPPRRHQPCMQKPNTTAASPPMGNRPPPRCFRFRFPRGLPPPPPPFGLARVHARSPLHRRPSG